ncbi:MAG: cbb3-type cytochrome c oxidase subunit I [Geobacteraceae bacterium]|nr:cbb3-type cytochrome c oxidase subunit I [Geobacteraceae bacterium]
MEYRSQGIAHWYFRIALVLFALQVIMGLWLAFNYTFTVPQHIVDVFPFATARAIHTNLLVLWMLLGFMGGAYYIVPEETGSDVYSPKLAWLQLIAFVATGVIAIAGVLQTYLERILGLGYMTAQSYMRFWMGATFVLGIFFLAGVVVTVVDLLFLKPAARRAEQGGA